MPTNGGVKAVATVKTGRTWFGREWGRALALSLATAVGVVAPWFPATLAVAETDAVPAVHDIRFGRHPDRIRIVIDSDGPLAGTPTVGPGGSGVSVVLPRVAWRAPSARALERIPPLTEFRFVGDGQGGRLELRATGAVELLSVSRLPPGAGNTRYRMVIDLRAAAAPSSTRSGDLPSASPSALPSSSALPPPSAGAPDPGRGEGPPASEPVAASSPPSAPADSGSAPAPTAPAPVPAPVTVAPAPTPAEPPAKGRAAAPGSGSAKGKGDGSRPGQPATTGDRAGQPVTTGGRPGQPASTGEAPARLREIESAASGGDVEAMLQVGSASLTDQHGPADPARAFQWFRKAADAGSVVGAFNVGQMYRMGLGVSKDERAASHWYDVAAKAGFAPAEVNLGVMKLRGMGGEADPERGTALIRAAAGKGNQQALKLLEELRASGMLKADGAAGAPKAP